MRDCLGKVQDKQSICFLTSTEDNLIVMLYWSLLILGLCDEDDFSGS